MESENSVKILPYLEWKNLTYSVKKTEFDFRSFKTIKKDIGIIKNVSGIIPSGSLVAILGASGAGKTSLLALISQRLRGTYNGQILINGFNITRNEMIELSAFVPQFDITTEELTAKEHLHFMCELRLAKYGSSATGSYKINEILRKLGIIHVADVRIGLLSGGERKKLNLATELLFNPSIIFCDEPTTGLDSYSALSVIKSLNKLTKLSANHCDGIDIEISDNIQFPNESKTILCSIHQPTSEVFHCFSHLILMQNGHTIFQGTSSECLAHFTGLGFICPTTYNPAEFYVKILAESNESKEIFDMITTPLWNQRSSQYLTNNREFKNSASTATTNFTYKVSWPKQVCLLLKRFNKISQRNFRSMLIEVSIFLIAAITIGLVYGTVTNRTQQSVQSIQGFLFIISAEIVYATCFSVMFYYPCTLPIIRRETGEHIYYTSAYYFSTIISSIPKSFIYSFAFILVIYPIIGFSTNFWLCIEIGFTLFMASLTSNAFGYMISACTESTRIPTEVASPILMIFLLAGGIYKIVDWPIMKYFSIFFYVNEALSVLYWTEIETIGCPLNYQGVCLRNGTDVLENYFYRTSIDTIWIDYFGLILLAVVMNLFGYIGVRRMVNKVGYY